MGAHAVTLIPVDFSVRILLIYFNNIFTYHRGSHDCMTEMNEEKRGRRLSSPTAYCGADIFFQRRMFCCELFPCAFLRSSFFSFEKHVFEQSVQHCEECGVEFCGD